MADGQATKNRITLKIGVVYDKNQLIMETKKAQATVDKTVASEARNRTKEIDKQTMAMNKLNNGIKHQKTLVQELSTGWTKTLGGFLKFSALSAVFMAVTVGMRRVVETIVALDTSMTNFNIVTKASQSEMKFVDERAGELANTLGRLKTEIIDATTEFARAGFSINDSMLLAENGIKAANAGGVELADIVTYVIAGLKSFKLEAAESSKILDVLFSVANMTAIDLEGIGEAFLRSANTLQTAGASLEESAALIAAANETIQDPAKVGTALKTIASRLRGVGDEGEVIPTLAKDFKQIGIEIQNADGSFRDIYSIFSDFAGVYQTLDDLTKQSLIEKIAGKRQANILIGLVENFDLADKSLQTALNSAGEVDEAAKKNVSSVQGQINILTNSFKSFFASLSNSESLTALIHLITLLVDGLTYLGTNLDKVFIAFGSMLIAANVLATGIAGIGASIGIVTALAAPWLLIVGGISLALGGYAVIAGESRKKTDELADSTEKLTEKQRENQQVVESGNIKAQKELADELQKQIDIIDELVRSYDDLSKSAPDDSMFGSNLGIQEFATDLNVANQAITEAEKQLAEMGYTVEEARLYIAGITVQTEGFTKAQYEMAEANFAVKQLIAGTSDEYQILSDALQQLEIDGYLTDDMLNTLIETYPDLVSVTGLQIDKVREYLAVDRASRDQILSTAKSNMKIKLDEAQTEVDAYTTRLKAFKSFMAGMGYDEGFISSASGNALADLENSKKVLQDAKNNIALLGNETEQLNATDKKRTAAIKESREVKEKDIKLLTESERALNKLNQEIALQQKLYERTDDINSQIKINERLIELYNKQKIAIGKVRDEYKKSGAGLKKTDEGYDDYINTLYDYSLQIEDATNKTIDLTKQNIQLANSMRDIKLNKGIESVAALKEIIASLVEQEMQDEIDAYKELIDKAKEQLDTQLAQIEAEKELADFAKDRLDKEKSISKIMSKMDSLRAAASQGDMRAINELATLEEERAEQQESLDQMINDRGFELRKEGLQNQYDEFESTQQKEIDTIEKNLNDVSYMIQRSNSMMTDYLSGNLDTLYGSLVDWNATYGTGLENDVLSKWTSAIDLIKQFNSLLGGSSSDFDFANYDNLATKDIVIAQMLENKRLWQSADAETKKSLNKKNIELGKSIGYTYKSATGKYYSDMDGSELFDNGGRFEKGDIAVKKNDTPEWILRDDQLEGITKSAIDSVFSFTGMGSPSLNMDGMNTVNDVYVTIEGSVSDSNVGRITRTIEETVKDVSKGQLDAFKARGIKPSVKKR